MFAFDMPIDFQQYVKARIHIASAQQHVKNSTNFDYTIGVCSLVENPPIPEDTAANIIIPGGQASVYLTNNENLKLDWSHWKVKVLRGPQYAELKSKGPANFGYVPTLKDYLGPDQATLLVEIGKINIKVIYHFKVMRAVGGTGGYDPYDDKNNCPNGIVWKISTSNLKQSGVSYNIRYSLKY